MLLWLLFLLHIHLHHGDETVDDLLRTVILAVDQAVDILHGICDAVKFLEHFEIKQSLVVYLEFAVTEADIVDKVME